MYIKNMRVYGVGIIGIMHPTYSAGNRNEANKMKNLRIALLISEFEDAYTNTFCRGVAEAVKKNGYRLFIFPGRFLEKEEGLHSKGDYAYQSNCLFHFFSENQIDIAIVNLGNIAARVGKDEKKTFLESLPVPLILVSDNMEGYSSVNYDNSTGMVWGIEHLMQQHQKKYFGYISGPRSNPDAVERQSVFEQVMIRNHFLSEQYMIVEGDFSSQGSLQVAEQLFDEFPQMDALVCGNDMMCFAAYQVMEKRRLTPGKDIAVMGFDDVPYASQVSPGLTTVSADASMLGYEAVGICERVLKGETHNLMVDTSFVIRESCGCPKKKDSAKEQDIFSFQANLEALNHCMVDISNHILNYEEENNKIYPMILESLCRMNVKSLYLYTYEKALEWKKGDPWVKPEWVRLRAYFREPSKRVPDIEYQPSPVYFYPVGDGDIIELEGEQQRISFDSIFSNAYTEDTAGARVVSLLYAGELQYGFLVWEVEEAYFAYISKLSYQVSNAIKTNKLLHKKSKITRDLEHALSQVKEKNSILEEISKVDELTQIYNRRGFLDHMKRNVIAKEYEGRQALAIYADMNNLKLVNDRFGHEEGDYSLRAIAEMLRDAIHKIEGRGEVGRIGGDEFCAYIISDVPDLEGLLRTYVDDITEDLNGSNGKPYYVSMSIGVHSFICSEDVDVSMELELADAQLYKYKKKKRVGIDK